MEARVEEVGRWRHCIKKCFDERVALERFETFARRLDHQLVAGEKITEILLDHCNTSISLDPLLIQYCQCLLRLDCIQGYQVLQTLLDTRSRQHQSSPRRTKLALEAQDAILCLVAGAYVAQQKPKSRDEALQTIRVIRQWMSALYNGSLEEHQQLKELGNFQPADHTIRGTVAAIVLGLVNNGHVNHILNADLPSGKLKCAKL